MKPLRDGNNDLLKEYDAYFLRATDEKDALVAAEDQSASSTAPFGVIRRAFGHAGIDPGHDLIDL